MLTQRTARGVGLLLAAGILGRVAALAAQVVAGWVLLDRDFGAFAMAIGIAAVAGLLRGGQVNTYLLSLPASRRRRRVGTVFWLSMAIYLAGVVPMVLLGPLIAERLGEPRLPVLLWLLAAVMMLVPLRYVLRSRASARLDFATNAKAETINSLVNYSTMALLVAAWRHPAALAAAPLAGAVAESAYLWAKARPALADFIPRRRFVKPLLYRLRWLLATAAMVSLWEGGDYFVAEFLVSAAVLGTYYFAYQLAMQPGRVIASSISDVLVPVVRRLVHEPARLHGAAQRLLAAGAFAIAVVNAALAAVIAPLEQAIWAGKWAEAVPVVQLLCASLVYSSVFGMLMAPLAAERRYARRFAGEGLRAAAIVAGAAVGSLAFGSAAGIGACVAAAVTVASLAGTAAVMRGYGLGPLAVASSLLASTVPVLLAGAAAAILADRLLPILGPGRGGALLAAAAAGIAYLLLCGVAVLALPRRTREELLRLLPGPLRRLLPKAASAK